MVSFLIGAISIGVILLFGSVGETITEKSGHLNLGIPGIMCLGTCGGCFGVSIYMGMLSQPTNASWLLLILFPAIFSSIFAVIGGLIYGFLTVTLRSNQNVTGLALTTFGAGFAQYFMGAFVDDTHFAVASRIIKRSLPFADNLGWFGQVFLSHGVWVYIAIAVAVITAVVFKRTKIGLYLRAVGENPATADAAGINVTLYKYCAIIIGSAIAGFGGLFYVMDYTCGTFDNTLTIQAFGWLSVALVIFTVWKPDLAILGSIVFGALYILAYMGLSFNSELLKLLPYVITIIVLIITSILGSKNVQPPASLGVNYFREER